uniref:Sushi domain-containing protein n=1 Tax=Strigamia maritima TaxID=126957 RepID=T1IU09_STRMM
MGLQLKQQIIFLLLVFTVSYHTCSSASEEKVENCERDEDKIVCEGRQCGTSCEKSVCKNPRAECLCDGSCGYVCVSKDLKCRLLIAPNFGFVHIPEGRKFHAKAYYNCSEGYDLAGPPTRICQSDGKWTENDPRCMPYEIVCAPPTFQVENAHIVGIIKDKYPDGSEVTYQCKEDPLREVTTTNLITRLGSNTKKCKTPEKIENGYYEGADDYIIGSKIKYHCNKGYSVDGHETITCTDLGVWSGSPPLCEIRSCPEPVSIKNGRVKYGKPFYYSSYVLYSCDQGFALNGPARRQCNEEGKLTDTEPKCIANDCGQPKLPSHGQIKFLQGTKLNQRIDYTCNQHTTMHGQSTAICKIIDGTLRWSSQPPICRQSCKVPQSDGYLTHGKKKVESRNYVPHEETIEILCDYNDYDDYGVLIKQTATYNSKCFNGKWDREVSCTPEHCKVPELDSKNVYITYKSKKIEPGKYIPNQDDIEVFCEYSYWDFGVPSEPGKTYTCITGKWNIEIICQPDTGTENCKVPEPNEKNAYFIYENKKIGPGDYVPNLKILQLFCESSFDEYEYTESTEATSTYKCINGKWSAEIGCVETGVTPTSTTKPSGTNCMQPKIPKFGRIDFLEGTKLNQRVDYTCDKHTTMQGQSTATCKLIKGIAKWSSPTPFCMRHCKVPQPDKSDAYFMYKIKKLEPGNFIPHHGVIEIYCELHDYVDYDYGGTKATNFYKCLNGKWDKEISCDSTIEESTPKPGHSDPCRVPELEIKDAFLLHNTVEVKTGAYIKHLQEIKLYCFTNYDYDFTESTPATSTHKCVNGKWINEIVCVTVRTITTTSKYEPPKTATPIPRPPGSGCTQPKLPTYGKIHFLEGTKLKHRVEFTCDEHTTMQGRSNATCEIIHGIPKWSSPTPFCRRHCKVPQLDITESYFMMYKNKELKFGNFVPHLDHIEIFCDAFYDYMDFTVVNKATNTYKCINGKWSNKISCESRPVTPDVGTTTPSTDEIKDYCIVPEPDITNAYFLHAAIAPGKEVPNLHEIKLFCDSSLEFDYYDDSATYKNYTCVNGKWSARVQCTPFSFDQCELPKLVWEGAYYIQNGKKMEPGKVIQHLDHVTLFCDPDSDYYEYDESNKPTNYVCLHGRWNEEMVCEPKIDVTTSGSTPAGHKFNTPEVIITYKLDDCEEIEYKSGPLYVPIGSKFTLRYWWVGKQNQPLKRNNLNVNFGNSRQGEYFEFFIKKVEAKHAGYYTSTSSTGLTHRINIVVDRTQKQKIKNTGCTATSHCNMDVFVNETLLKKAQEHFKLSSSLTFRCTTPLEFRLVKNTSKICNNEELPTEWPHCVNIYPNGGKIPTN